jgi:hypothetical protein
MAARGYRYKTTSYQLGVHHVFGVCNADGVAVSGDEGSEEVTTAKTATGTYTLTMKTPFRRKMLYCSPVSEIVDARFKVTISGSVATVVAEVGGTDTDMKFNYHIAGADDITRRG